MKPNYNRVILLIEFAIKTGTLFYTLYKQGYRRFM